MGVNGWNPDATLDGDRAEGRARWLMTNQAMTCEAAIAKVMVEFPAQFTHPSHFTWNPEAPCDGTCAEGRVQWLMNHQSMTREAAIEKVMAEFPAEFAARVTGWNPDA